LITIAGSIVRTSSALSLTVIAVDRRGAVGVDRGEGLLHPIRRQQVLQCGCPAGIGGNAGQDVPCGGAPGQGIAVVRPAHLRFGGSRFMSDGV